MIFFMLPLFFGVEPLYALGIGGAVFFYVFRYYKKFFIDKKNGYIIHLVYTWGAAKPYKEKENEEEWEKNLIPYGFENEFRD